MGNIGKRSWHQKVLTHLGGDGGVFQSVNAGGSPSTMKRCFHAHMHQAFEMGRQLGRIVGEDGFCRARSVSLTMQP